MMLLELLPLYKWTIPAGTAAALTLAWLGVHLSARDRSLQSFCVTQGATLGVLLGLGLGLLPLPLAVLGAIVTFMASEYLTRRSIAGKSTVFGAVFIVLTAISYLVGILFPGLEMHAATLFFGDLATLSTHHSQWIMAVSLSISGLLWYWRLPLLKDSFEMALFGDETAIVLSGTRWRRLMLLLTVCMLSMSVQYLGFLFTISCLYLPTVILGFFKKPGIIRHLILAGVCAGVSVVLGFLLSLVFPHLPTVPTIILTQCFLLLSTRYV